MHSGRPIALACLTTAVVAAPFFIACEKLTGSDNSISIQSPTEGEKILAGMTERIRWSGGSSDISISFSSDNGTNWAKIADVPCTDPAYGDYPWIVPQEPSTACCIKLTAEENSSTAISGVFSLSTDAVAILSPNAGDVLKAGDTACISWKSPKQGVVIYFTSDAGLSWEMIGPCTADKPTWGNYPWGIPNISSTECRLKFDDYTHSFAAVFSETFTIED